MRTSIVLHISSLNPPIYRTSTYKLKPSIYILIFKHINIPYRVGYALSILRFPLSLVIPTLRPKNSFQINHLTERPRQTFVPCKNHVQINDNGTELLIARALIPFFSAIVVCSRLVIPRPVGEMLSHQSSFSGVIFRAFSTSHWPTREVTTVPKASAFSPSFLLLAQRLYVSFP